LPTATQPATRTHARLAYQPALDGLRAVAVLFVIAYHLGWDWAPGGFLGVDTFFVLSGFLITSLLLVELQRTGRVHLAGFWGRRARRLLPALFLVLVAVAIYAAIAVPHDELHTIRGDGIASLLYVANWRFIQSGQSYFALFSTPSPLRHVWSLAIEEQFYLVWPLITYACFALARGSSGAARRLLGAFCVAGIAFSAVGMSLLYEVADPSRAYYGTDTRAQTLLVGCLLAILLSWREPRSRRALLGTNVVGVLGAFAVAFAFLDVTDRSRSYYHGGSLLFAVGVAAVIFSATRAASPLRTLLSPAPLRWIGRISYGLYLWHWPVQVVLTPARVGFGGLPLDFVRIAATFGFATASFYAVERPIRRGHFLRGPQGWVVAPASFVATAMVTILATTAATAPPPFLQANGDVVVTPSTTPIVHVPPTGGVKGLQPGHPSIVLVGDSVAASLQAGFQRAAALKGLPFHAAAIPGCGLVTGTPTDDKGTPWVGAKICDKVVPSRAVEEVRQDHPDLVVWLSTWEISDRIVDGQWLRFGTPQLDHTLVGLIQDTIRQLSSTGAGVVILTLPPRAKNPREQLTVSDVTRPVHLDDLFRQVAAADPTHVSVVDFSTMVCPGGAPCPTTVDGIQPRPNDGEHYEGDGPNWAGEKLVQALLACRPSPVVWRCPAASAPAAPTP
jgi:peptidoglycan/LPS O-acetylase OafA/YrhL